MEETRKITLHPYQRRAVDAVLEAWREHRSALLVMPTGTGKTIAFASIIAKRNGNGRSIVLAHRDELIRQAVNQIQRVTGLSCDVEKAEQWADQSWMQWRSPVIVSSIQTQCSAWDNGARMMRFVPDEFSTCIVDEAHHCTSESYRRVLDHYRRNPQLRVLGATATPNRHDEEALGQIFDVCAFQYDLADAIRDGWLSPLRSFTMPIEDLDLSSCRTTAGDLNGADAAREYEKDKPLLGLANAVWREANGRKTLVFTPSVESARRLCGIFNTDYDSGCSRFISGKMDENERRGVLAAYREREFQILVNCQIATEGFDDPGIEVVVPKPTKSSPLYIQMIGRAMRTLPGVLDSRRWDDDQRELGLEGEVECAALRRKLISESAKPWCEVLDLHCQSGRHRLISAVDVLGGKYEDRVIDRAKRNAISNDKAVSPDEMLKRAADQLRHEAEVVLNRKQIMARASYRKVETDPFAAYGIEPARESAWHRGRKPTDKMLNIIQKHAPAVNLETLSFSQASRIIDELKRRWSENRCTLKQGRILAKFGFQADMKRELAKPIIDIIASNGWRWPNDRPRPSPDGTMRAISA